MFLAFAIWVRATTSSSEGPKLVLTSALLSARSACLRMDYKHKKDRVCIMLRRATLSREKGLLWCYMMRL